MILRWISCVIVLFACFMAIGRPAHAELVINPDWSTARVWLEAQLENKRYGVFRPTVNARNCYHLWSAMWDCWAAYDATAAQVMHHERQSAADIEEAREEAISYAAYRLLMQRYPPSENPVYEEILNGVMQELGYNRGFASTVGNSPAAFGNRVASTYIFGTYYDGANELMNYAISNGYEPANEPLVVELVASEPMADPNRWQPLALEFFIDKTGVVLGEYPKFTTPHWGLLPPFSMLPSHKTGDYLYYDPGPPPYLGGVGDETFREGVIEMVDRSSRLDPADSPLIDISPASMGNNPLGTDADPGYEVNPVTGLPYEPQMVPEADYARVISEFWFMGVRLSGPDTYWFRVINKIADDPGFEPRIGGTGPVLNKLEWDVKAGLALAGSIYDAAIACWGAKYFYDYARPISMVRNMALLGQSSDSNLPSYHPQGIPLVPGLIELITEESTQPGERHEHLAGSIEMIAVRAWAGPPENVETDVAGVKWILGTLWMPHHPGTFVTPAFAGYTSGHSTMCRAGAETVVNLMGTPWFPGGLEEFEVPQGEYMTFEKGPSVDMKLQWASFYDVSDCAGIARRWSGVHVRADDLPGRILGSKVGKGAWEKAAAYFDGSANYHSADMNRDEKFDLSEILRVVQIYNVGEYCYSPGTEDGFTPGAGLRESCLAHRADNSPQDWVVDHGELLRIIQLYNADGFYLCPEDGTEDGFCLTSL